MTSRPSDPKVHAAPVPAMQPGGSPGREDTWTVSPGKATWAPGLRSPVAAQPPLDGAEHSRHAPHTPSDQRGQGAVPQEEKPVGEDHKRRETPEAVGSQAIPGFRGEKHRFTGEESTGRPHVRQQGRA